jgi:hypothetical protein
MVDIETYKKLHPSSVVSGLNLLSNISRKEMMSDDPLLGDELLLFPPIIPGYNLLRKTWGKAAASHASVGIC